MITDHDRARSNLHDRSSAVHPLFASWRAPPSASPASRARWCRDVELGRRILRIQLGPSWASRMLATAQLRYHLRSAGTTYQGAFSVSTSGQHVGVCRPGSPTTAPVVDVARVELPVLGRVVQPGQQPFALLLVRDVQHHLDDRRPVLGQLSSNALIWSYRARHTLFGTSPRTRTASTSSYCDRLNTPTYPAGGIARWIRHREVVGSSAGVGARNPMIRTPERVHRCRPPP